jgi:hypothetical protein
VGALSRLDRIEIGELLLKGIRKPSEITSNPTNNTTVEATSDNGPKVTSSIGVSWQKISKPSASEDTHNKLRKEADAALYRAKADGRDCLREYEDIRHLHGRISKYYPASDLVQIDIGSSVGVKKGDVYAVYTSPFTGEKHIYEGDNSSKVLGKYPKIEAARICAIDVQKEITICVVLERSSSEALAAGSLLKYIYKGSMRFPFRRHSNHTAAVGDLAGLEADLSTATVESALGAVIAISGNLNKDDDRPSLERVDDFLVTCFLFLPPRSRVYRDLSGGLYAILPRQENISSEQLVANVSALRDRWLESGHGLRGGVCIFDDLPPQADKSPNALLFYCQAALLAIDKDENLHFFKSHTPNSALHRWRKKGLCEDAIVDYQQFKIFGFGDPLLDNQLGLAILENDVIDHFALAEAAFKNATKVDPTEKIYLANLGLLQARRGKYADAFATLEEISDFVSEEDGGYLIVYARSALEVYRTTGGITRERLGDLLLETVTACESISLRPQYNKLFLEVREALKTGEFD